MRRGGLDRLTACLVKNGAEMQLTDYRIAYGQGENGGEDSTSSLWGALEGKTNRNG